MNASTSLMVPKEQLTRVQGFNQMLQGALGIVSAPLGALLVSLVSTQLILMIDVLTAAFAIVPLLFIDVPQPVRRQNENGQATPSFWQEFRAGLVYVLRWPGLLAVLGMAMMINFMLNPAGSLLPLLITGHFQGGALELGWAQASFGVGMLVGGVLLGIWGGFRKRIVTTLLGLVLMGLGFAGMGLLPSGGYQMALIAAFFTAMMMPIVNGPLHAILQASVDPEMQGRVFTLVGSLSSAMAPLGLVIAGPLSDAFGIQIWYIVGGVTCSLMGIAGFLIPAVMKIEEKQTADGYEVGLETVAVPSA
jgi:DHA3 family macrolide efflux protein-like MFS transporter